MSTTVPGTDLILAGRQQSRRSFWRMALNRPEIGSLGGVVLVFVFFFVMAPPFRQLSSFTTILYQSAVLGIPSVAVALLMIGGEFDLSAGVAVTTSSLTAAIVTTELTGNVFAASSWRCCCRSASAR